MSRMDGQLGEWDRPVVRRLYGVTKRAQAVLAEAFAAEGATVATWGALDALDHGDGISQRELARRVRVEEATMAVQLRKMLRDGLCRREADPGDRRVQRVYLTEQGRRLLQRLHVAAERAQRRFLAPLSVAQQAHLVALLTLLDQPADPPGVGSPTTE